MADEVLAQLGLDAKSFTSEVNAINAHLKSLEKEEKLVNVQIALLEKNMRLAGNATGAQIAQLGQLRQALKAVRSDMKEVSRGKQALGAVDPNSPEEGKEKKGGSGRSFLAVAGILAAISAIRKLGDAALELGDKAIEARTKFQAGGNRLSENLPGQGAANLATGLKPIIQDKAAAFGAAAAGLMLTVLTKTGAALAALTGKSEEYAAGLEEVAREGKKHQETVEKLLALEDGLADAKKNQTPDLDNQLSILQKQLEAEQKKLELANLGTNESREQANQAKEAIGATKLQIANMEFARDQQQRMIHEEMYAAQARSEGQDFEAKKIKLKAEYQQKIAADERENNGHNIEDLAATRDAELRLMDYQRARQNAVQEGEAKIQGEQAAGAEYQSKADAIRLEAAQKIRDAQRDLNSDAEKTARIKEKLALLELQIARQDELSKEHLTTMEIGLQAAHMGDIASRVATWANDQDRINKAIADGNVGLAETLKKQQDIHDAQGAVAEHNMTLPQRRAAAAAARKFSRDAAHERGTKGVPLLDGNGNPIMDKNGNPLMQNPAEQGQEGDLKKRLERANKEGHKIAPSSRLGRYAARMAAGKAAQADQTMKVTLMNTAKMIVSEMKITVP